MTGKNVESCQYFFSYLALFLNFHDSDCGDEIIDILFANKRI